MTYIGPGMPLRFGTLFDVSAGPGAFVNPIGTTPKLLFDAFDGLSSLAESDPIATWTDQGSLLKDLTSAGALRPTKSTLNGLACATFSGSNNMNTATFTSQAQPSTIFIILQTTFTAAQQDYLDGLTTSRHLMFSAITTVNGGIFAGTVLSSTTTLNNAAAKVITGVFNGASSKLYINGGAAVASGAGGANPINQLWIGSNYLAGNKLTGKIQFVALFNAALSTADMTTFGQYIGTRYGPTVSTYT